MNQSKSEVLVVTSGKGGVGKTTTTANIGVGLAQKGLKVCLIDTDIGLRNLDVVLGLENRIVYNLVDVVEGKCRVRQALIKEKNYPSLYVLPSAQSKDKTAVSPSAMTELVDALKNDFDYILLDCPAGIEQGFQNAVAGADKAILVTSPEISSIRDANRVIGLLEANGIHSISMILNGVREDLVRRGDMMSASDVVDLLSLPLLGVIPDDKQVVIAANQGQPVISIHSTAGKAYRNIVERLLGTPVPILPFGERISVFSRLIRKTTSQIGGQT